MVLPSGVTTIAEGVPPALIGLPAVFVAVLMGVTVPGRELVFAT